MFNVILLLLNISFYFGNPISRKTVHACAGRCCSKVVTPAQLRRHALALHGSPWTIISAPNPIVLPQLRTLSVSIVKFLGYLKYPDTTINSRFFPNTLDRNFISDSL